MHRYYTRVCNFYYGNKSKFLVNKKKTLPLSGNKEISFDYIEIISRKSKKKFSINKIAKSDAPVDAKEISVKMIEFFMNPINGSLFWIALSLFFGLIYSLIGGLAMKKTEA